MSFDSISADLHVFKFAQRRIASMLRVYMQQLQPLSSDAASAAAAELSETLEATVNKLDAWVAAVDNCTPPPPSSPFLLPADAVEELAPMHADLETCTRALRPRSAEYMRMMRVAQCTQSFGDLQMQMTATCQSA
jgi:hypothetical protein